MPVFRTDAEEGVVSAPSTKPPPGQPAIDGARALAVVQADALKAYRDLSAYRVQVVQETDGWHIDYELKDAHLKGGGPHYVIDSMTGASLAKRYEQ